MNWAEAFFYSVVAVCVAALVANWMDKLDGETKRTARPEKARKAQRVRPPKSWTQ